MFGASNPMMSWVEKAAGVVREERRPAGSDNPFLALQEQMSGEIVNALEGWRKMAEKIAEETFRIAYGAPAVQAALGIDPTSNVPPRKAPKSLLTTALIEDRIVALKDRIAHGGVVEGLVRSMLFVGMARGVADERGFEAIRRIRQRHPAAASLTLAEFKTMVREQYYMLLIDEQEALAAIPALLPADFGERQTAFDILREVLESSGTLEEDAAERLDRVGKLFSLDRGNPGSEPALKAVGKPTRVRSVS
jgi:hypothetical protein